MRRPRSLKLGLPLLVSSKATWPIAAGCVLGKDERTPTKVPETVCTECPGLMSVRWFLRPKSELYPAWYPTDTSSMPAYSDPTYYLVEAKPSLPTKVYS